MHSKYELGIGDLTLDFAGRLAAEGTDLRQGDRRDRQPDGDRSRERVGRRRREAPRRATCELLGQSDDGTHVRSHLVDRTGSGRVLVLDVRTGLGRVQVERG